MAKPIGNEENMAKVKELMATAQEVNAGGNVQNGVLVDYKSEFDGNRYKGRFIFKRPTMMDYMQMGAIKAQMLGAFGYVDPRLIDGAVNVMATTMSTLRVVIVKAPEWLLDESGNLDLEGCKDPSLMYHILAKYEEWENSFRPQSEDDEDGDSSPSE